MPTGFFAILVNVLMISPSLWLNAMLRPATALLWGLPRKFQGGWVRWPITNGSRPFAALTRDVRFQRPPLNLIVRNLWTIQPPASFFLGYRCFYGMGYQLSHLRILCSRMPLKIATLPLAFRLLFGRFFVSQLTYLGCWHTGLCIIHHFPRGTVSELV